MPASARSPHAPPGAEGPAPKLVVSRLVHSVAQRYFKTQLEVVGSPPKCFSWDKQAERIEASDTRLLNLGKDEYHDGSIRYYENITFEKKYYQVATTRIRPRIRNFSVYQIGDFVATVVGKYKELETRQRPPSTSTNRLANESWCVLYLILYHIG